MPETYHITLGGIRKQVLPQNFENLGNPALFREIWEWSDPSNLSDQNVTVNIESARALTQYRIRQVRAQAFPELDIDYLRAIETADTTEQTRLAQLKQIYRDAPAHSLVVNATTIDALIEADFYTIVDTARTAAGI